MHSPPRIPVCYALARFVHDDDDAHKLVQPPWKSFEMHYIADGLSARERERVEPPTFRCRQKLPIPLSLFRRMHTHIERERANTHPPPPLSPSPEGKPRFGISGHRLYVAAAAVAASGGREGGGGYQTIRMGILLLQYYSTLELEKRRRPTVHRGGGEREGSGTTAMKNDPRLSEMCVSRSTCT